MKDYWWAKPGKVIIFASIIVYPMQFRFSQLVTQRPFLYPREKNARKVKSFAFEKLYRCLVLLEASFNSIQERENDKFTQP